MAFANPLVLTVNAVPYNNAAVSYGDNVTSYRTSDGLVTAKISHLYGKKPKSMIRFDFSKISADPFIPATNQKFTQSAWLVFERPVTGFTVTEQNNFIAGVAALLTAPNIAKLTAGES